jgi:hypothetical protein
VVSPPVVAVSSAWLYTTWVTTPCCMIRWLWPPDKTSTISGLYSFHSRSVGWCNLGQPQTGVTYSCDTSECSSVRELPGKAGSVSCWLSLQPADALSSRQLNVSSALRRACHAGAAPPVPSLPLIDPVVTRDDHSLARLVSTCCPLVPGGNTGVSSRLLWSCDRQVKGRRDFFLTLPPIGSFLISE